MGHLWTWYQLLLSAHGESLPMENGVMYYHMVILWWYIWKSIQKMEQAQFIPIHTSRPGLCSCSIAIQHTLSFYIQHCLTNRNDGECSWSTDVCSSKLSFSMESKVAFELDSCIIHVLWHMTVSLMKRLSSYPGFLVSVVTIQCKVRSQAILGWLRCTSVGFARSKGKARITWVMKQNLIE